MPLTNIGAGWENVSKNGNRYISVRFDLDKMDGIRIEDMAKVLMFKNKSVKQGDKKPDWVVSLPLSKEVKEQKHPF